MHQDFIGWSQHNVVITSLLFELLLKCLSKHPGHILTYHQNDWFMIVCHSRALYCAISKICPVVLTHWFPSGEKLLWESTCNLWITLPATLLPPYFCNLKASLFAVLMSFLWSPWTLWECTTEEEIAAHLSKYQVSRSISSELNASCFRTQDSKAALSSAVEKSRSVPKYCYLW